MCEKLSRMMSGGLGDRDSEQSGRSTHRPRPRREPSPSDRRPRYREDEPFLFSRRGGESTRRDRDRDDGRSRYTYVPSSSPSRRGYQPDRREHPHAHILNRSDHYEPARSPLRSSRRRSDKLFDIYPVPRAERARLDELRNERAYYREQARQSRREDRRLHAQRYPYGEVGPEHPSFGGPMRGHYD